MTYRETFTIGGRVVGEVEIPHEEEIRVTTEVRGWRAAWWKIRHPFRWAS